MTKWIYTFGDGAAEGRATDKNLLGGKGANLAEMCSLGLPVPPGFTITTEVCNWHYANGKSYPDSLRGDVDAALGHITAITGRSLGDPQKLLLVSVRSGARASMPGMMDTVLNLGLNDETVKALAAESGDERFAYDSYRRFITMYSNVVLDIDHGLFEEALEDYKERKGLHLDTDLSAEDWKVLVGRYKDIVKKALGSDFPQEPEKQLWGAVGAVFSSWMNARAIKYRELNSIPASWGTAVNVQSMVFGNMGDTSATGVAFTRNPSTGENALYGEFLINAQGEDVVAGIRTPQDITEKAKKEAGSDKPSMEMAMPEAYAELVRIYGILEKHYRDMQDLEFTIERGKLWMLQTRSGKRTAKAALKIAVDMATEGLISKEEAVARIDPASLDQLLHPTIDPKAERHVIGAGLPGHHLCHGGIKQLHRLDVAARPAQVRRRDDLDAGLRRRGVHEIAGLGEHHQRGRDILREGEVAIGGAARDLQVDAALVEIVALDQLLMNSDELGLRPGEGKADFAA